MIVNYDRTVITIVNYDHKIFMVHATGCIFNKETKRARFKLINRATTRLKIGQIPYKKLYITNIINNFIVMLINFTHHLYVR